MIHKNEKLKTPAEYNIADFDELPSCGIEDLDRAVFDLFDSVLPMYYVSKGNTERIPVIYATGERAVLIKKHKPLRDTAGALILPLISIARTGISQDPPGYGIVSSQDEIIIKKRISSDNLNYKRMLNENNFQNQDHDLIV